MYGIDADRKTDSPFQPPVFCESLNFEKGQPREFKFHSDRRCSDRTHVGQKIQAALIAFTNFLQ